VNRRLFAPSFVAVALTAVLAIAPANANAQGVVQPTVRITDIVVNSVEVDGDELIANAVVTLDVLGRTVTQNVEIPLGLDGSPGEACDILHLEVGPVHLDLLGLVVNLDDCEGGPIVLDIDAFAGEGLLGDLLCGIAGLLDGGLDLGDVLGGLTDLELAALTGVIQEVLNDLFEGVLNSGGGAAAAHQASASGAHVCDILTLELPNGITLELLGLVVDTSGICLDVHAERGSGNLLGNLLCGLTGLLDGPANANAIQAHVRNLLRLLDRLDL
jgi:hypothetical protein